MSTEAHTLSKTTRTVAHYSSEQFVISAGTVLFRRSSTGLEICLIHRISKDHWLLPKGRKDCGECIADTAIRETFEETGYACKLLPVTMKTRAPQPLGIGGTSNTVREIENAIEPFMMTVREMSAKYTKFIWWYVSCVIDEDAPKQEGTQMENEHYESHFLPVQKAIERLSFPGDKEIVQRAVELVGTSSYGRDRENKTSPHSTLAIFASLASNDSRE